VGKRGHRSFRPRALARTRGESKAGRSARRPCRSDGSTTRRVTSLARSETRVTRRARPAFALSRVRLGRHMRGSNWSAGGLLEGPTCEPPRSLLDHQAELSPPVVRMLVVGRTSVAHAHSPHMRSRWRRPGEGRGLQPRVRFRRCGVSRAEAHRDTKWTSVWLKRAAFLGRERSGHMRAREREERGWVLAVGAGVP
jgi:hypothetical protein